MYKPIRVLIVDDSKPNRMAMSLILKASSQITVVGEAVNGEEAIEMVNNLKPDVVVMDVDMPVLNGLEATQQIKKSHPYLKIIIASASSLYVREAHIVGADMFLPKDQIFTQLRDSVLVVTGRHKSFRTAAVPV